MRKVPFNKYQGTGNDFIIIDNRDAKLSFENEVLVKKLCDRRFGIGADGLILLENSERVDFRMIYYNSDGKEGSMCGNGGRCIVAFASSLGIIGNHTSFEAIDGIHEGEIIKVDDAATEVSLQMNDVKSVEKEGKNYILDTGSPHYVMFGVDLESIDVKAAGGGIRYNNRFREKGINVNFAVNKGNSVHIRTYERGVEDETLSCGTGSVAAAIALYLENGTRTESPVGVLTLGGLLKVSFSGNGNGFTDIRLIGPAVKVFEGTIALA